MSKCYKKICPKCSSQLTKKDGTRKWRQSYKCCVCYHVRISKSRSKPKPIHQIYHDYSQWKHTYKELSTKYDISIKTVQSYLDQFQPISIAIKPKEIVLLVDTTYFWKRWLMVFKDALTTEILLAKIVTYETNEEYYSWIKELISSWRIIKAMVVDWRKWLITRERWFPVQLCNFHQQQVVRRLISNNPKTQAWRDLKSINNIIHQTEQESFELRLNERYDKHHEFVNERWINGKWKAYYIHKKLRSAYNSLKRNAKYLFVYQQYFDIINIPNTTNGLEWMFSHLKYKVNLHRWLREDRKKKLVLELINSRKKPHLNYN